MTRRILLGLFGLFLSVSAFAAIRVDGVDYAYFFRGTQDAAWTTTANWYTGSEGAFVPYGGTIAPGYANCGGAWGPLLVDGDLIEFPVGADGTKAVNGGTLEGWNLELGVCHGVTLTMAALSKLQGETWGKQRLVVDETSKLVIQRYAGGNTSYSIVVDVASPEGLTVKSGMARGATNGGEFHYRFRGQGSMRVDGAFNVGNPAKAHLVEAAHFRLRAQREGWTKWILHRKLIGFASSDCMFALADDASVTVDSEVPGIVPVIKREGALTTDDPLGTVQLRKGSDGLYLDYVGYGDPDLVIYVPDGGTTNWTETISDEVRNVSKCGGGTVTFTAANAFTGTLVVEEGVAKTTVAAGFGAGRSIVVKEGATLDVANTAGVPYDVTSAGRILNGGAAMWAATAQMRSLTLDGDTIVGGPGCNAFGLVGGATSLALNGHTLTVEMPATGNGWNFELNNTAVTGPGRIVVKRGRLIAYGNPVTMTGGTLELAPGALLELNANLTVDHLVSSGTSVAADGVLTVRERLEGRLTAGRLAVADGTTIKLPKYATVSATTAFTKGTTLTLDLSDYIAEGVSMTSVPDADTLLVLPAGQLAQGVLDTLSITAPRLRDEAGCRFYADGNAIKFGPRPLTLYWNAWRGTFWENFGGTDVNGNHGLGRDEAGIAQAILIGDTLVFDKAHYTDAAGQFAEQTAYWHYDENLYIKNEVPPGGTRNEWDIMVLEGVNLKLGLRGPRASGQNLERNFKIYIEEGARLELGYWGNTHHYQGVFRDGVKFGGGGEIVLGADLGSSLRLEGDVRGGDEETGTPTLNLMGKELVFCGKADGVRTDIATPLTGFGSISATNENVHLNREVDFGSSATIDATGPLVICDDAVRFGDSVSVRLTAPPEGEGKIKVLHCDVANLILGENGTDVRVLVNGSPVPAFFELVQGEGGAYVQAKQGASISYAASPLLGYDYRTMLVDVTMTPPIEGVVVTAELLGNGSETVSTWTGTLDAAGRATVMVGDEDNLLVPNATYRVRVSVDGQEIETVSCFVGWPDETGDNLAEVDGVKYPSMREAVAASRTSGKPIRLLTNVFFAPPPGTYGLVRDGHLVRMTNDLELDGAQAVAPRTVTRYDNGAADESARFPFTIAGEWLGWALPWRTRRQIQSALLERNGIGSMTRWQAYVLGFPATETLGAAAVENARALVLAEQTGEAETFRIRDDRTVKDARESGVDVVRTLLKQTPQGTFEPMSGPSGDGDGFTVDANPGEDAVGCFRIGYSFQFEQEE